MGNTLPANAGTPCLPRLPAPIHVPVMITAANAMRSATAFALAHPSLALGVSRTILKVEKADYQTAECRNVVLGHAHQMLDRLMPLLEDKEPVVQFARRQLHNSRPATRKRAETFSKSPKSLWPGQYIPKTPTRFDIGPVICIMAQ